MSAAAAESRRKKRSKKGKRTATQESTESTPLSSSVQCVCLQVRAEHSRVDDVRKWFSDAAACAHQQEGHVMSTLIMPSKQNQATGDQDILILYAFDSPTSAARWHASATKIELMKSLAPLIKEAVVLGGNGALRVADDAHFGAYSNGWESSFVPDPVLPNLTDGSNRKRAAVPPRWKQAISVYLAVCIVAIPLGLPGSLNPTIGAAVGTHIDPWRSPIVVLLGNLVGIPLVVFLVLPLVVRLLAPWLHMPKPDPPPETAHRGSRFCYNTFC
jgi:antibiotic biosynthesis monooxygenase (ABM) superfamily enzyme